MNPNECAMLDMLRKGRDEYGVVAVKAEFEAEGTRPDELLRLLELAYRADVGVALKIGGCEAVSDLLAARLCGADYLIAPMVETPYALTKFVDAKRKTWGENSTTKFLFNLETGTTLANLDAMLPIAKDNLHGIVFGRVDFTQSCGLERSAINTRRVSEAVLAASSACAQHDLEFVVGGGVGIEAVPALREFRAVRLDRFETRKVVFDGASLDTAGFEKGIANAVAFELAWLENKRAYYAEIAEEDAARIRMMRERSAKATNSRIPSLAA